MPRDIFVYPGDALTADLVNRIEEATELSFPPGMNIYSGRHGSIIGIDPLVENQNFIRTAFLARLLDHGPNGEPDQEGAMYWAREVRFKEFGENDPRPKLWLESDDPGTPPTRRWWAPVLNLAEYLGASPDNETHDLIDPDADDDDQPIVEVRLSLAPERKPVGWINTPTGGGATVEWVVVRDHIGSSSWFVEVESILRSDADPWNGTFRFGGERFFANCRPGSKGRHFEPLVYKGSNPNSAEIQAIELVTADGASWVTPWAKTARVRVPEGSRHRISDCHPLRTLR